MSQLNADADRLLLNVHDVVTLEEPPSFFATVEIIEREIDDEMVRFKIRVIKIINQERAVNKYNEGDEINLEVVSRLFNMAVREDGALINRATQYGLWAMTRPAEAQTETEA